MKRFLAILLLVSILASSFASLVIAAEPISYASFTGEILTLANNTITMKNEHNTLKFDTSNSTIVSDLTLNVVKTNNPLKVGNLITTYFNYNEIEKSSNDNIIKAIVIVINESEEFMNTSIGIFNDNFLNENGTLKLNVSKDTPIYNINGNKLSVEDIKNQFLIVFYQISTRSIPPQAIPEKILLLNSTDSNTFEHYFQGSHSPTSK